MELDIKSLREDLIDYFKTAINPFDVDLEDVDDLESFSDDKLIKTAKKQGFNLNNYIIESSISN